MSYLVVNNTKSYHVTNEYVKPYIHINGSILPLTSNGGGVINLNINNTSYRPLEYKSQSASDTYYTSAVNSEGLSSTTALTRSSTSGESYETRSSTSGTSYGTTVQGQSYFVNLSTYSTYSFYNGNYTTSFITYSGYEITNVSGSSTSNTHVVGLVSTVIKQTLYFNETQSKFTTIVSQTSRTYSRKMTISSSYRNQSGDIITRSTQSVQTTKQDNTTRLFTEFIQIIQYDKTYGNITVTTIYSGNFIPLNNLSEIGTGKYFTQSCYYDYRTTETRKHSISASFYTSGGSTVTTGTTYLTRSSTSKTVYLTRSSTSGYSGVSSSSSESSGWE